MKFITRQYTRAFSLLREAWKFSVIVTALLIFSGLIGYLLAVAFPETFDMFVNTIRLSLAESGFFDDEGNISAVMLFFNNARAAFYGIGQGLFPFIFAPALSVILNGSIIGVVLGFQGNNGANVLLTFLAGIMPHGIFELPSLIISWSAGMLLCYSMIRLIFGKISGDVFLIFSKRQLRYTAVL